jgi:hypothetical protein
MSSSSLALSPARIEDLREIPIDFPSGRLDFSTTAAFDGLVASLFTQPNPPILMDRHYLTFVGSLSQRSIFELIKHPADCGRTAAFSIPPMILDVLEMWCFPRLLDIYLDRGSALNGGRL